MGWKKICRIKPKTNTWVSHEKVKSGSHDRTQNEKDIRSNSKMCTCYFILFIYLVSFVVLGFCCCTGFSLVVANGPAL